MTKMTRVRGMQKTTSHIGCVCEIGLEEKLVNLIKRFQMLGFYVHPILIKLACLFMKCCVISPHLI
jgi:hypothetical protein